MIFKGEQGGTADYNDDSYVGELGKDNI